MSMLIKKVLPAPPITQKIYFLRGTRVMLDSDLAQLYGVTTKNLNKAVKRNEDRFPSDFMFRLKAAETKILRFQSGTSSGVPTMSMLIKKVLPAPPITQKFISCVEHA